MIEEPPPNVRFILATTEAQSFKPTIHSRCITLTFEKIDWYQLYNDLLIKICKLENVNVEEDALKFIAKRAKGSARNALQNLQTTINFSGGNVINLDIAQKALGAADDSLYFNFIQNIIDIKPNYSEAVKLIDEIMIKGKNSDEILNGLEYYLRNLLIAALCKENLQKMGFSPDDIKRLESQIALAKASVVSRMVGLMIDVRRGTIVNMDLQLLLIKFVVDSLIEVAKSRKK
jgi:DNA polymerase-3 subunit gamma/tau